MRGALGRPTDAIVDPDQHHVVAGRGEPICEGRPRDPRAADQDDGPGRPAYSELPQYLGVQQAVLRFGSHGGIDGMAGQAPLQLESGSLQHSN